jgi:hypothetical protein
MSNSPYKGTSRVTLQIANCPAESEMVNPSILIEGLDKFNIIHTHTHTHTPIHILKIIKQFY